MTQANPMAEAVVLHRAGRLAEAEAIYRCLLAATPALGDARRNLARVLARSGRHAEAADLLRPMLDGGPGLPDLLMQLGAAYAGCERYEDALVLFERVLAESPEEPQALQFVAHLQQQLGRTQQARESFGRALTRTPLLTVAAGRAPAAFRALLIFAPGAGNTPFDFLIEEAPFDTDVLTLLPGVAVDAGALRDRADVVVNLVADADLARDVLGHADDLTCRLGLPLVNPPEKIRATGRAEMARRLARIPACVVPRTYRVDGLALANGDFDPAALGLAWPLLLRPAGTHGGEHFERAESRPAMATHLGAAPAPAYYVSEFIDSRSADGYFRKYRFFFVGGAILPYHLAIDSHWKVHHATTDMANHRWMQEEEREFLAAPWSVFSPAARLALEDVRQAVGLDFFGIDCALDDRGRVVIFEVNACMLAHGRNERFPYKTEAVQRIRTAFQTLLQEKAGSSH